MEFEEFKSNKLKKEKKEKKDKKEKKEKKEKKRKLDEVTDVQSNSVNESHDSKKLKVDLTSDEFEFTGTGRRRTRSMSEAEENNKLLPSQSPEEFRKLHQITVTGFHENSSSPFVCPDPMLSFKSAPFASPILKALEVAGFTSPTPTQALAWPIALAGRDIITVAKTGSGKTCGFLLPAIHRLLTTSDPKIKRGSPGILVIAPTRELACQIEEEAIKFGRNSNIRSCCAYGGSPKSIQLRKIQAGIEILIATPGRLNDFLEMGAVNLSQVLFFVLDEADRMLDMGFEPDIRKIVSKLPKVRQTMFFTATWPREVQALAREFLVNPIEIKFGDTNNLNANKKILQKVLICSDSQKPDMLQSVLKEINPSGVVENVPKSIIFVSRKHACDRLANDLWNQGYSVDSLHGDKQQWERTKVMDQFKKGQLQLLVATDVAARGLDVKDIAVVINYDFPAGQSGVEDYVHRIGRTARGEADGKAFTFFTADDSKRASQLIGVMRRADQVVPDDLLKFDRSGGGNRGFGGGFSRGGFGGRSHGGRGFGGGRGRKW